MRLVSAAKYAALQSLQQRTARDLEAAEKLAANRLGTITRLRSDLAKAEDGSPATPLPQPEAAVGDAELRRRLQLAERTVRELTERLGQMQATHEADTRELHDLRQGVTS
ncbi:hypothetical protein [Streptomyces cupreus]|uniref:Uncharacterized protein n=1 Tax=Streptomyces cupreus TaxID=2759956 RepID=A0A7X1J3X5_9ACTN|nr:hypothetical protein [Streptomyces cupreus]MBC2903199.1 hypothetical protein [Streptomyces cupreus]